MAQKKITALHLAIDAAVEAGVQVSGNIVMSDVSHASRVQRVINTFNDKLIVRILPDLDRGVESLEAIYGLLGALKAEPVSRKIEAGSSNSRIKYQLPNGREIYFKQISHNRLSVCGDCSLNNPTDCKEGYYGVRLYVDDAGTYKIGVCIQRMDLVMPVEAFIASELCKDILERRESQYTMLKEQQARKVIDDVK